MAKKQNRKNQKNRRTPTVVVRHMQDNKNKSRGEGRMWKKIQAMFWCLAIAITISIMVKSDDGLGLNNVSAAQSPMANYVEIDKQFQTAISTQDKVIKETAKQVGEAVAHKVEELKQPSAEELHAAVIKKESDEKAKAAVQQKQIFLAKALTENDDAELNNLIYERALANGIDPYEALYQVKKESTFDENAYNEGCYGLTQISHFAVTDYKKHHPNFERPSMESLKANRELNLEIGFFYLKLQKDMWGGNIHHALMSYNGGAGYAEEMIDAGHQSSYYSRYIVGNAQKLKDKDISLSQNQPSQG